MDTVSFIAGSTYAMIGFVPLPIYARLIWVLLTHSEYRKYQCYYVMAQIGIFDCLVIFGEGVFGITVATGHLLFGVTVYIAMPLAAAAWMAMLSLNLVLAVNRLKVLCGVKMPKICDKMLICGSYLFGLFFTSSYFSQQAPLIISEDRLSFFYDMDVSYGVIVEHVELYSSIVILGLTFLIYVYVISHIIKQRVKFNVSKTAVRSQELLLLGQSLVVFIICGLLEITWNIGEYILPDSPLSSCAVNAIFILHSGWINPGICLLLNRKVRRSVFELQLKKIFVKTSKPKQWVLGTGITQPVPVSLNKTC